MAPKRGGGEGSKKAAGQARKAETAANKKASKEREEEASEATQWEKGTKDTGKKEAAAAKAAELARKKAERAALEQEEMASMKTAKTGSAKSAAKKAAPKARGLDLSQLDESDSIKKGPSLDASGIDNALDALNLTAGSSEAIDRHPERRYNAAYTQFENTRLEEMKDEKGLRRNQKIMQIKKEFEKHPDNPFNQVNASYNTKKEDVNEIRRQEKEKIEGRLTGKNANTNAS